MDIENIKLNNFESKFLDKAVEKSNKNFKFIIDFMERKKENLSLREIYNISSVLKEFSFSSSPVMMDERMIEDNIFYIIAITCYHSYIKCFENDKNFENFFKNYYLLLYYFLKIGIKEGLKEISKKNQKEENNDIENFIYKKAYYLISYADNVFWKYIDVLEC